jgi:hypothetical protein
MLSQNAKGQIRQFVCRIAASGDETALEKQSSRAEAASPHDQCVAKQAGAAKTPCT